MFTSCCPGWVAMVEKSNPELIPYLSSCKSPQMMLGAVIKNYFARETGKSPTEICNVSVMPCVRKQGEADREWFNTTGEDIQHHSCGHYCRQGLDFTYLLMVSVSAY